MKFLLALFFLFFWLTESFSQDGDFIELENGNIITGQKIEFRSPAFKASYLLVDDKDKYELSTVRIYQIHGHYYKKMQPPGFLSESFFLRTAHGRIDAYSKASTTYVSNANGGMTTMSNRWDYYSKDDGPLKKMRYRFLKKELTESAEAMKVIKKIKTLRYVSAGLYVGGSALIVSGIASTASSTDKSKSSGIPGGVIAGALTFTVNMILLNTKRNMLTDAIDAYNTEIK